jgi:hypothetical protein
MALFYGCKTFYSVTRAVRLRLMEFFLVGRQNVAFFYMECAMRYLVMHVWFEMPLNSKTFDVGSIPTIPASFFVKLKTSLVRLQRGFSVYAIVI